MRKDYLIFSQNPLPVELSGEWKTQRSVSESIEVSRTPDVFWYDGALEITLRNDLRKDHSTD